MNGSPWYTFDAKPGFFFIVMPVPAGALTASAPYVPLEVKSEAADDSGRVIAVGLEQFDLQSAGVPMVSLAEGWHEPEYDPRTARSWRWVSEQGVLWVRPIGRDVTLRLTGESPLRYFSCRAVRHRQRRRPAGRALRAVHGFHPGRRAAG